MIRMRDIAEQAGVSQSTVSFVLNGRHEAVRISEQTRQRVLKAADDLGYRTNQVARAVRTGNTRMVGIVGGELAMEQVGTMLGGVLEELDICDYTLKILSLGRGDDSVTPVIQRCAELRLMGVIAMHLPLPMLQEFREEALRYSYPLVLLDSRVPETDLHQIVSDDAGGIAQVVRHLAELGHTRIALLNGEAISTLAQGREAAFRSTMMSLGLEAHDHLIRSGDFGFQEVNHHVALDLLRLPRGQRPTAIVSVSDRIALMVLHAAHQLGLSVPHDVSLTGFSDFSAARFSWPPLTTVAQPFEEMGRAAARHLISCCNSPTPPTERPRNTRSPKARAAALTNPGAMNPSEDNPTPTLPPSKGVVESLPTRLIVRESTSAPARN